MLRRMRAPSLTLLIAACAAVAALLALGLASRAGSPQDPTDARGWHAGTVAVGTAEVLAAPEPVQIDLPADLAARVKRATAFLYFSPLCPHCQHAMPEINALVAEGTLDWVGVATVSTQEAELADFRATYGPTFDIVIDTDAAFARASGARSTPSLLLVRPVPDGAPAVESVNAAAALPGDPPMAPVLLFDAWLPFRRGASGVIRMRLTPDDPFSALQGYQSDTTCGACHQEEARSWTLTHHAVAYPTLYAIERAQDVKCVGCHVTGLGEPGGFTLGDHSSPLSDVSCEACHGPAGPHDGEPTDARATCAGCHDEEHSVAFSVDKGLPHIDHFLANALSDEDIAERRYQLTSGQAERPLLAFPTGPTLGADACKSCHKSEHKAWRSDPHAAAMQTLGEGDRERVACVSCHATAAASGPLPAGLDGYRTSEGVGCEACHGPGGDHIAAPTADNIIGLGASCPECIIEGICTTCHTPAWDPGWSLKTRLKAISH